MILLLLACADDPAPPAPPATTCGPDDAPELLVIRSLHFTLADTAGVSDGFDLDSAVSTEGGATGCGLGDYTSPAGVAGIDNAFSRIAPTLDATEAKIVTIEGLVQDAINSGALLLTFQLGGVDDWTNDACVSVEAGKALGTPMMGTDGAMLDGQSFDPDPAVEPTQLTDGLIADGALEAHGLTFDIPVQILNASLVLPIRGGAVRVERATDDLYTGVFAGGVSGDYMMEVASTENVDPVVAEVLGAVLDLNADLPDDAGNSCAAVSMTFSFEAVGAWWYPTEAE